MQAQPVLPDVSVCHKLPVALRRQPGAAQCNLGFAPVMRQARLSRSQEQRATAQPTQRQKKRSSHSPRLGVSAASSAPAAADQASSSATPAAEQSPSAAAETPALADLPAPADTPASVGTAAPARKGKPAGTKESPEQAPEALTASDEQQKHNLPFEIGDVLVGTVVRGSKLGVHVKLSNYEGLLG